MLVKRIGKVLLTAETTEAALIVTVLNREFATLDQPCDPRASERACNATKSKLVSCQILVPAAAAK